MKSEQLFQHAMTRRRFLETCGAATSYLILSACAPRQTWDRDHDHREGQPLSWSRLYEQQDLRLHIATHIRNDDQFESDPNLLPSLVYHQAVRCGSTPQQAYDLLPRISLVSTRTPEGCPGSMCVTRKNPEMRVHSDRLGGLRHLKADFRWKDYIRLILHEGAHLSLHDQRHTMDEMSVAMLTTPYTFARTGRTEMIDMVDEYWADSMSMVGLRSLGFDPWQYDYGYYACLKPGLRYMDTYATDPHSSQWSSWMRDWSAALDMTSLHYYLAKKDKATYVRTLGRVIQSSNAHMRHDTWKPAELLTLGAAAFRDTMDHNISGRQILRQLFTQEMTPAKLSQQIVPRIDT